MSCRRGAAGPIQLLVGGVTSRRGYHRRRRPRSDLAETLVIRPFSSEWLRRVGIFADLGRRASGDVEVIKSFAKRRFSRPLCMWAVKKPLQIGRFLAVRLPLRMHPKHTSPRCSESTPAENSSKIRACRGLCSDFVVGCSRSLILKGSTKHG